jgi:hypothetical protein
MRPLYLNLLGFGIPLLVLSPIIAFNIWQSPMPANVNSEEVAKKVEVIGVNWRQRDKGTETFGSITLKNSNNFAVHNIKIACSTFNASGIRTRITNHNVRTIRAYSMQTFERYSFGEYDEEARSIACSVASIAQN